MSEERKYEIAYILSAGDEPVEKICETLRATFSTLNIHIENENDMGMRTLAYPIRSHNDGHYYVFSVKMTPDIVRALGEQHKNDERIVRYLVVRMDDRK